MTTQVPRSRRSRARRALVAAVTATVFVLLSEGAANSVFNQAGGRETDTYDTQLVATDATLTALTQFYPHENTCVLQGILVHDQYGHQAETGLLRCNNHQIDAGECTKGHLVIELETSTDNFTCFEKSTFDNNIGYPASVFSTVASNYTAWSARIDGQSVSAYTSILASHGRQARTWGEVQGSADTVQCPTSFTDMFFTNWEKTTLDIGTTYIKGAPRDDYFTGTTVCFDAKSIDDTGDYHVKQYLG